MPDNLEETQPSFTTQAEAARRSHRARPLPNNAREILEALTDGAEETLRDAFEGLRALAHDDRSAALEALWRIVMRDKALWKAGMYASAAQWDEARQALGQYEAKQIEEGRK